MSTNSWYVGGSISRRLFSPIYPNNNHITLELGLPLRKTPLVYDIQELFRWLVDVSVLLLLEEKKLKKYD
jgi:hypothetical protein